MKVTLRQLRRLHDLSQKDAADALGVHVGTWTNWEKQKTFPDAPQIAKIEEVFNIHYKDIIFFDTKHGFSVNNKYKL